MGASDKVRAVELEVAPGIEVSGSIGVPEWWPSGNRTGLVMAHDLGSDQNQALLIELQQELTSRGLLNIRFNFPFAQSGKKRPDPQPVLERSYRTAVQALVRDPEEAPAGLILAGFGLGARVASQVIAAGAKADALICLSYPLHPAGKPSQQRTDALFRIICPILFIQGSRDANCRIDRLELLRRRIGAPTQLAVIEDGDHDLAPVKRSSRSVEEIHGEVLAAATSFIQRTVGDWA